MPIVVLSNAALLSGHQQAAQMGPNVQLPRSRQAGRISQESSPGHEVHQTLVLLDSVHVPELARR